VAIVRTAVRQARTARRHGGRDVDTWCGFLKFTAPHNDPARL